MKRRTVLLGATTALSGGSGCLGRANDSAPRSTEMGDFSRTVSIARTDSVPARFPVNLTLDVAQPNITSSQTARLTATVTNTGTSDGEFDVPYYKGASSDAGDPGILLYAHSAPDSPSTDDAPDCIATDGKSENELGWSNEAAKTVSLDPDETASEKLLVADDPTTDGCFPTGTYGFETRFGGSSSGHDWKFDWGFTLRVEANDL